MKTKILFFAFLTFVFTAIGQTITPDVMPGDYHHAHAISPSGNFAAFASDGDLGFVNDIYGTITVPTDEALLRIFAINTDNTFSMTTQVILPKGTTSSAASGLLDPRAIAIDDVGNWAIQYQDDHISGVSHSVLIVNGVEIASFGSIGVNSMEIIDGALYTSGQSPSGTYFKKYSMTSNSLLWSINPGGNTPHVIKTEGFDPHLKMSNGDLIRFDDATGANLGVIESDGDVYQINPNSGQVEYYRGDTDILETDEGKTDWFDSNGNSINLFTTTFTTPDRWLTPISGERSFVIKETNLYSFSRELNHSNYKNLVPISYNVDLVLDSKIFDNGDVTLIAYTEGGGSIDDTISIHHIPYTTVEIPTLSDMEANVVSIHPGQVYNTEWVDTYENIGTIVLSGTMPNIGDVANFGFINEPSGYSLYINGTKNPIIRVDENNNLFVRFVFKPTGSYEYLVYKLYLKSSSALGVDENSLDVISGYFNTSIQSFIIRSQEQITQGIIYNTLGQEVAVFSRTNEVSLRNVKDGVYYIQLITDSGRIFKDDFIKH